MADPTVTALTRDTWIKVATNITAGTFDVVRFGTQAVFQTYRMTGNAAPTDLTDGIVLTANQLIVAAPAAIDLYLYAQDHTSKVRISL